MVGGSPCASSAAGLTPQAVAPPLSSLEAGLTVPLCRWGNRGRVHAHPLVARQSVGPGLAWSPGPRSPLSSQLRPRLRRLLAPFCWRIAQGARDRWESRQGLGRMALQML